MKVPDKSQIVTFLSVSVISVIDIKCPSLAKCQYFRSSLERHVTPPNNSDEIATKTGVKCVTTLTSEVLKVVQAS